MIHYKDIKKIYSVFCSLALMHNSLMTEVVQAIHDLDSGDIYCPRDKFYLKVPKDDFSPHRDCIVILERTASGWQIAVEGNEQFNESR